MVAARLPGLDVVLCFQDAERLDQLGRAVFSVLMADYRPLTAIVVCRRFGPNSLDMVRTALSPLASIAGDAALRVLDFDAPGPPASLLNRGLQAGAARYAAFLDVDGLVYPEAYRLLAAELERSGAAIAFGGALTATVSRDGVLPHVTAKHRPTNGRGLRDLLQSDVHPPHSLVLDRGRIHPDDLVFDQSLPALEHDDLLLRLCARYPSSFALTDTILAEHLLEDGAPGPARDAAQAEIRPRKAGHVLTRAVQSLLGIDEPGLTTKTYLDRHP